MSLTNSLFPPRNICALSKRYRYERSLKNGAGGQECAGFGPPPVLWGIFTECARLKNAKRTPGVLSNILETVFAENYSCKTTTRIALSPFLEFRTTCSSPSGVPPRVRAERDRDKEALNNLVRNIVWRGWRDCLASARKSGARTFFEYLVREGAREPRTFPVCPQTSRLQGPEKCRLPAGFSEYARKSAELRSRAAGDARPKRETAAPSYRLGTVGTFAGFGSAEI